MRVGKRVRIIDRADEFMPARFTLGMEGTVVELHDGTAGVGDTHGDPFILVWFQGPRQRTKSGQLGVSIDDGETVFNAAGRRLPLNEKIWSQNDDAIVDHLTPEAFDAAVAADDFENAAAIERADAADAAAAERAYRQAETERIAKQNREAADAYWMSPAGRARRKAELETLREIIFATKQIRKSL